MTKRPVLELVNFITVGLLPPQLRRQFGLTWDPLRALMLRGGAEYAKRVLVPLAPGRLRFVSSARARRTWGPRGERASGVRCRREGLYRRAGWR